MSRLSHLRWAALAILATLTLWGHVARAQSAFEIISPSGGETWEVGVRRRITWSGPSGGNVRIELSRDGGTTYESLFSNTPNNGTHEWEVEDPLTTTGRIRITWLENQTVTGVSAADFSIVDAVIGLTVTQPKAGDTWLAGSTQHIKWNAAAGGDVKIERTCDGGATFETIAEQTPNDGEEPWVVRGPLGQCRFRITHLDDAGLVGESGEFTVAEPLGFRLTAPSGGEVWATATSHLILWDSPRGGRVRIEVSRDGGLSYRVLFADTPNDGAEEWNVDELASPQCRIRLTLLDDPSIIAVSAADFAVVDQVVGLTVVQPAASAVWVVGTQQLIKWNAPPQGTVKIELTRDGGATFETLFAATPNDGQEFWTVTGPIGHAHVRITRVEDASVTGDSGEFSITRVEGVLVTAPNGSELWTIGSRQFIRWQGIEGGRVTVELSRDAGATWEPLFTNRLDHENASLAWVVEGPPSEDCLVRVTRTTAPFVSDISDQPFGITIAPLTVTAPVEGDELVIGTQRLITWSGLGFGQVGIDLSRDGGVTWETVFARTPNDGAQFWTVSGPATGNALVRVIGLDDLPGIDVGDGPFEISAGRLDVVQPNGGERWRVGSPQLLTWNTTTAGAVRAEISRDGGPWEPLFANTPNDGRELWTVSGPPCAECFLRLVSLPSGELDDVSDGPFSIFCAPTAVGIAAGEEKTGTLQPGQCEAPHHPGSRGQLYSFTMAAAGRVLIDLATTDFQPYLLLIGPEGQPIAQSGGASGHSRLEVDVAAGGPYTIEVTSADSGGAGAYLLSLVRFDVTLLTPKAGEVWKLGDLRSITWRSGAPTSPIDILLFRDGNPQGHGEALFMTTANDGEQTWKVTGPPSAAAVIQVCVPDGSTGGRSCATSPPFALQTCLPTDTRSCYSGSARTQGVGACRAGHLECRSGSFGTCVDEVLPTPEVCGDGIDQDCDGSDALCTPCVEQGGCADDDPCTADSCAQGDCVHDHLVGWPLLDCRRDVVRLTLSTVDASCQGTGKPNLARRQRKKLSKVLSIVEKSAERARATLSKPRCVKQLERARQMTERFQYQLGQVTTRGSVCDQSPLLTRRIVELSTAIVGVSSCAP